MFLYYSLLTILTSFIYPLNSFTIISHFMSKNLAQFHFISNNLVYKPLSQSITSLNIRYSILFHTMTYDPNKSLDHSKVKSLTQQWTNLIKQFKYQSKPRVDLPPIIFQRKSPLQNYKNAIKLHQSIKKKKTITQKILNLQKRRKVSTININQEIRKHRRLASQHVYTLTEQQKQLLNSKQLNKSHRITDKQKEERINSKQIIKQIRAYHDQFMSNNKQKGKNQHLKYHKKQSSKKSIIKENTNKEKDQNSEHLNCSKLNKSADGHQERHEEFQSPCRRTRLSFQLSKDYKSLKFRYERDNQSNDGFNDSIPRMLIKNRRQKLQHMFSLYSSTNNNFTESERVFKPYVESQTQDQQRKSQIQLTDRKRSIIGSKENSPVKLSAFSPLKDKGFLLSLSGLGEKQGNSKGLRMEYEPWRDVVGNKVHSQSCNVDFSIENYHSQDQSGDQSPLNSNTVMIM